MEVPPGLALAPMRLIGSRPQSKPPVPATNYLARDLIVSRARPRFDKARRDAMAEREHHRQVLQRARAADASGDRAGCLKALDEAGHDRWTTERSPARLRDRSQ